MRSWWRPGLVGMVLLTVATPRSVSAQSGLTLRGLFVWGAEASAFRPCNAEATYWLTMPDVDVREDLVGSYMGLTGEPYEQVYVEMRGWPSTAPAGAFAEEYDGSWRVTDVVAVSPVLPASCEGVTAPIWLDMARIQCPGATTRDLVDCETIDLIEGDFTLGRYATEALRYAADGEGLFRSTEAWEDYRDVQCAALRAQWSGGSLAPLQYLACRRGLSEERLDFVWEAYLLLKGTDLDPPPGVEGSDSN